jgi:prepilin-type N-terminal cleavage/methylation domain-containing protein
MLARIRKSMNEKDAGFTLVELLVVMLIIGILAAVAIPVFLNQRKKAVDTSIKSDIRTVAQEVETTFIDTQTYPVGSAANTWTAVTATTVVGTVVTPSPNNVLEYKSIPGGYCLRGQNSNGTATGTNFVQYASTSGGLRSTIGAISAPCA